VRVLGQRTKEQGCIAMAMHTMYVPNIPRWSIVLPQRHVLAGLAYSPNAVGVVTGVVCRAADGYHMALRWT
jgi:hypothetical protein